MYPLKVLPWDKTSKVPNENNERKVFFLTFLISVEHVRASGLKYFLLEKGIDIEHQPAFRAPVLNKSKHSHT